MIQGGNNQINPECGWFISPELKSQMHEIKKKRKGALKQRVLQRLNLRDKTIRRLQVDLVWILIQINQL